MNWRNSVVIITLICCLSCKKQQTEAITQSTISIIQAQLDNSSLVEAELLVKASELLNLKIIDFRKKESYLSGHIPDAIQIWRDDIENPTYPYKGMMAKKETIEQLFSKLGIKTSDMLVLYDDKGSCDAARLWWVLKSHGFDNIRILNGGIQAWLAAGGVTSKKVFIYEKTIFTLPTQASKLLITKNELNMLLSSSRPPLLIDTRTYDEYTGKRQKLGAAKAGRIPKSKFLDWAETIDYENTMKFKPLNELEKLYTFFGYGKSDTIITYCHTGVRSAHTTFILTELLGYNNVKNYDGSWSEWSYYDELPFEKDSITVTLQ
ncbi:sulfurtransferase [uncultured Croceitalea sp.]|uniref:sulfurtransferase n=1 Tax=uncultured Croceitalea sp. TaxID=1798908 RepID=UPI00374FAA5D